MAARSFAGTQQEPDFPAGMEWLSCNRLLSFSDPAVRVADLETGTVSTLNLVGL